MSVSQISNVMDAITFEICETNILRWVSHLKTWEMMMNLLVFYYSIKNPNRIIQIVSNMYNLDFRLTLNRQDNS